jgi:hypothetical protein
VGPESRNAGGRQGYWETAAPSDGSTLVERTRTAALQDEERR